MTIPATETQKILRVIETWPTKDQIAFAQMILERTRTRGTHTGHPAWRQMAGLASTDRENPSDEDVARWLEEHRVEKYG